MLRNPFGNKKEKSLGVDIGTSSVKIVEFSRKGDKLELTNYGEFVSEAERALYSSSVKLSPNDTARIIKTIIQEAHIISTDATMSIPVFSGFSTVISLPDMSDAELDRAVSYEAKKYIPLPLSEVQFEWTRLENSGNASVTTDPIPAPRGKVQDFTAKSDRRDILIVAVTKELISKYQKIAKLSGLALSHLELDTFSLARSFAANEGSNLIIDIGSRNTILSIVKGDWPVFSRTVEVSGYELTKLLASSLGIDFSRAEERKKKKGIDAGADVILPLLDSIFLEGRRIIDEYSRKKSIKIKKAILVGGTARMPGIREHAAKTIGLEVVVGFPFSGIIYPKELDSTLHDLGPSFSIATGLALREFR
jgi:type IV pilus assembly protein PilM